MLIDRWKSLIDCLEGTLRSDTFYERVAVVPDYAVVRAGLNLTVMGYRNFFGPHMRWLVSVSPVDGILAPADDLPRLRVDSPFGAGGAHHDVRALADMVFSSLSLAHQNVQLATVAGRFST